MKKRISNPKSLLLLLLLITVVSFSLSAQDAMKDYTESFDVTKGITLSSDTRYSDVELITWDKNVVDILAEVEVEAEKSVNPIAKKVIESVSKETFFSAEMEELKKEIEELKTQLSAQTNEVATEEVAPVQLAEEVKPISFNPENEKPIEGFKISSKAGRSTMDNILSKINNI